MRVPARFTLGDKGVVVFPDGRVLVMMPPTDTVFGCVMSATVLYPDLVSAVEAMRMKKTLLGIPIAETILD